jgi:hypothetical protein
MNYIVGIRKKTGVVIENNYYIKNAMIFSR